MKSIFKFRVKNCPICGHKANCTTDYGLYTICCDNCASNGIKISVSHEDINEAIKKWNSRPVFNKICERYNYLHDFFDFYSGRLTNDDVIDKLQLDNDYKLFSNLFFDPNKQTSGCLITKSNETIPCLTSHLDSYKDYMHIDDVNVNGDILDRAVSNGLIRVSFYGKCLITELNKAKVNSEQIISLYKYIDSNKNSLLSNINTWGLSYPNSQSDFYNDVFDYLNAILLIRS